MPKFRMPLRIAGEVVALAVVAFLASGLPKLWNSASYIGVDQSAQTWVAGWLTVIILLLLFSTVRHAAATFKAWRAGALKPAGVVEDYVLPIMILIGASTYVVLFWRA